MALTPFDLAPDPRYEAASRQVSNLQMRPAYEQAVSGAGQGANFNSAIGGAQTALLSRTQQPFLQAAAQSNQDISQQVAGQTLAGHQMNDAIRLAYEKARRQREQDMMDTQASLAMNNADRATLRELAQHREDMARTGAAINLGATAGGAWWESQRNKQAAAPSDPDYGVPGSNQLSPPQLPEDY